MKPSGYHDRIVDVLEELVRFTVLLRLHADQLVDRYSERGERDEPVATPTEAAGLVASVQQRSLSDASPAERAK